VLLPQPQVPLALGKGYTLAVVSREGEVLLDCTDWIRDPALASIQWSADSRKLALIGRKITSAGPAVFLVTPEESAVHVVMEEAGKPRAVTWSCNNRLLVLAAPGSSRADWWLVESGADPQNLTKEMPSVPPRLFGDRESPSLVGLADHSLWCIRADALDADRISGASSAKLEVILWSNSGRSGPSAPLELFAQVKRNEESELCRIKVLANGSAVEISPLDKPAPAASVADVSFTGGRVLYRANDSTGSYLWVSGLAGVAPVKVFEANTFLRDISHADIEKIEYQSLEGHSLKAWVVFPVEREATKRYPLVSLVYAGRIQGDSPPAGASMFSDPSLNPHLLAAKGYAVLIPSMPLEPRGQASDPLARLTNGLMPAVDKLIEMGIADPDRLGLIGRSFGGYTTYGLLTQTNRFRAAVALAGASDLISLYGTFDARSRYTDYAHERLPHTVILETGQGAMGAPPWRDLDRYIRNSPLFQVERIETPVMIIHGDMDYVGIQQGEELFTALYRLNKRARFVRYWGEAHILQGPAAIQDMWERVYDWFGYYLKGEALA
jgi:dienelactone hydrolase